MNMWRFRFSVGKPELVALNHAHQQGLNLKDIIHDIWMNNTIIRFLINVNHIVFQRFGVNDHFIHLSENSVSLVERTLDFIHMFKKISRRSSSLHTIEAKKL